MFKLADTAMLYAWLIRIVTPTGRPPIYFYLDADWRPNAFAFAEHGDEPIASYASAVTVGLITNTLLLVSAAMSDELTLPGIGKMAGPVADRSWIADIAWGSDLLRRLPEIEALLAPTILSFDKVRTDWLMAASQYAVWFAMQHEWAHIYQGHLDWLLHHSEGRRLAENDDRRSTDSLTDHAMENQADASAALALLKGADADFARCAGFGVGIGMSLFTRPTVIETADMEDHPHTSLRALSLCFLATRATTEMSQIVSDEARHAWSDGFTEAQLALKRANVTSAMMGAALAEYAGSRSEDRAVEAIMQKINVRNRATYERCRELVDEVARIDWWVQ